MFLQSKGFRNTLSFREGILRKDDECWPRPETPALEDADFRDLPWVNYQVPQREAAGGQMWRQAQVLVREKARWWTCKVLLVLEKQPDAVCAVRSHWQQPSAQGGQPR